LIAVFYRACISTKAARNDLVSSGVNFNYRLKRKKILRIALREKFIEKENQ
jgi:hypothetical protein